jgi:hypothetical protein
MLEIVLHVTWNSAFIDAEQLRDYCREEKLGQRNFQQQLRHIRKKFVFSLPLTVQLPTVFFTLFARERGFYATAVLLV